jgi:hypothetical protein
MCSRARPAPAAQALIATAAALLALLLAPRAFAGVLPVPADKQHNLTTSCGSCGSSSTGMGLAYLGEKNTADEVEHWLYPKLPCGPGEGSIVPVANQYCASHGLPSPCATHYDWASSEAWARLVAEIDAGRPFGAHTDQWGGHYVLVVGWTDDGTRHVHFNDPAKGYTRVFTWTDFAAIWSPKGYDGIRFTIDKPVHPPALDARFVSQGSDAPADPEGKAYFRVCAGERVHFWFELENTGTASWVDWKASGVGQSVRLGVPDDATDSFTGKTRLIYYFRKSSHGATNVLHVTVLS